MRPHAIERGVDPRAADERIFVAENRFIILLIGHDRVGSLS